jgi:acyl-CoA synthetase (AMP-forming)/AMP-acid ligase II
MTTHSLSLSLITALDRPFPRGEICVRKPVMVTEYYRDESATRFAVSDTLRRLMHCQHTDQHLTKKDIFTLEILDNSKE